MSTPTSPPLATLVYASVSTWKPANCFSIFLSDVDISVTPPCKVETHQQPRDIPSPPNHSKVSPQIMKAQAAWGKGNVGDFLDLTRDSEDGFEEGSSSLEFGSDSESNSDFKFLSELLSESKPESKTKSDSEGLKLKGGAGFFLGAPPCTGDVLRSSRQFPDLAVFQSWSWI